MRATTLAVGVVIACMVSVASEVLDAQRNQRAGQQPAVTFVDMVGPPATLADMFRSVDFVVLATVTSSGPARRLAPSSGRAVRDHILTVREIFKANEKVPVSPTFKVVQVGGTVEVDGHERTTAFPFPLLVQGDDVFLFLNRELGQDYFYVAFNGGAIPVDNRARTVSVPELLRAKVADFSDRRLTAIDDLVARLRQLRDR